MNHTTDELVGVEVICLLTAVHICAGLSLLIYQATLPSVLRCRWLERCVCVHLTTLLNHTTHGLVGVEVISHYTASVQPYIYICAGLYSLIYLVTLLGSPGQRSVKWVCVGMRVPSNTVESYHRWTGRRRVQSECGRVMTLDEHSEGRWRWRCRQQWYGAR